MFPGLDGMYDGGRGPDQLPESLDCPGFAGDAEDRRQVIVLDLNRAPSPACAASGSGGSSRDAAEIWAIGLAVAAAQSWRVSMNTGNCRVVLAWCSSRVGYSATSFGHSSARAAPASSSARTVSV